MAVMMVAGERAERTAFAAGISGRSRQQLAGQNPCYFSFEDQGTAAVWIEAGGVSSYLGQSCCLLVLPRSSELDDFEGCFLEGHCLYFEGWCSEAALDRVEVQGQITGSWVRDYWQDWGS